MTKTTHKNVGAILILAGKQSLSLLLHNGVILFQRMLVLSILFIENVSQKLSLETKGNTIRMMHVGITNKLSNVDLN